MEAEKRTIESQWKALGFDYIVQLRTVNEWLDYALFKTEADAVRFINLSNNSADPVTFRVIRKA